MKQNQSQLNQDLSNRAQTQTASSEERMSSKEWLEHSNKTLEILGIKERSFKNAGKCFVMPYNKPPEETTNS